MSGPTQVESLDPAILAGHRGATLRGFAVLRHAERRQTKQGKAYWDLTLGDRSGTVPGKVWDDARQAGEALPDIQRGSAVKIEFEVDQYKGAPQLKVLKIRPAQEGDPGYDHSRLYGDAPEWLRDLSCKTLVFDIETVPDREIRDMPPTIVKSLTEFAKRKDIDENAVRGLSPFFGKVVSLAFGDGDSDDPSGITALVVPREQDQLGELPEWIRAVSEPELLECFWCLAEAAETVVSYNGRGFDVPFLAARSLIHGIPARVDLLSGRWSLRPHLDLLDVLGQRGRGPSNLDVVCWSLGIESPKGSMDGSMVAPAYSNGRILEIAEYNRSDVRATAEVFRRTRDGLLRFRPDWN